MSTGLEDYVLGRDMHGSVRLDAQHLLWKIHNGYALNPKIAISPGMKIAEIGTGTALWLLDIADHLPSTIELHGYDVSDGQFPPQTSLPRNVSLGILDAFGDVPPHLVGKYDVIHLRFWCCVVRGNDPSRLIRHAVTLLKPRGYLQWEDAHLGRNITKGIMAEEFGSVAQEFFRASDINYNWLGKLDKHVTVEGLEVIDYEIGTFRPTLVPLCTSTYLTGHFELFQAVPKLKEEGYSIPNKKECENLLVALFSETKKGEVYHWPPVTLLARKAFSNN
ncbi:hypothetical protein OIDMADRAFT_61482 [Oidiodendron maius Zn]|uniref:Methyltransferase domain-containing protein n=1 Tax=Oidiodendron maius (strain Zn) TaxID=913774 RepID=A0A0C3C3U3_OIDMZ|nr:hypothetical protein OIDMADRAFT_61482 [Oidiodendron maius Zn]